MYYFTSDTIAQANNRIKTLDAKAGGLLCVLHCLPENIEENFSYTINGEMLRRQLSFVFDKELKDTFETAKPSYIIFAKDWANTFFTTCIKSKIDLLSCAVFFLRRCAFDKELTNDEVINTFINRFNIRNYKDSWFISTSSITLKYNQNNVEENQIEFYSKMNYISEFKSILFNGIIQKPAADLKAAGQIQTLYSGSGIQKCFLLSDESLDKYYIMSNSKSNETNQGDDEDSRKDSKITHSLVGKNIILYGVPGCGKSHEIKTKYCDNREYMERVVFHPNYTYSDFVGQILPQSVDGHISYPFVPGPFTRILKKAVNDPANDYYLVIEELNRGNAPAIFGEVFQLLDRKDGISEYGINNADIAIEVYGDEEEQIKLPSNLYILATMNTADQNVFTLDTAFKRRWTMKRIPNNIDECDFRYNAICGTNVSWRSFVIAINNAIDNNSIENFGNEDKRLGAYFVSEEELNDVDLFSEKVLMYLWNDAFKNAHEKIFAPEYKTLDSIIDAFKLKKMKVFINALDFTNVEDYNPNENELNSDVDIEKWNNCSEIAKSWLQSKKSESDNITSILIKKGITYKRFTTKMFDAIIPSSENNTSDWHTRNHYFYELCLKGNKLYVQFVCNIAPNTPQNIIDVLENNVIPKMGRQIKTGQKWYALHLSPSLTISPETNKDVIENYLDECYEKLLEFENKFF